MESIKTTYIIGLTGFGCLFFGKVRDTDVNILKTESPFAESLQVAVYTFGDKGILTEFAYLFFPSTFMDFFLTEDLALVKAAIKQKMIKINPHTTARFRLQREVYKMDKRINKHTKTLWDKLSKKGDKQ